jgi:hypothetical protein
LLLLLLKRGKILRNDIVGVLILVLVLSKVRIDGIGRSEIGIIQA